MAYKTIMFPAFTPGHRKSKDVFVHMKFRTYWSKTNIKSPIRYQFDHNLSRILSQFDHMVWILFYYWFNTHFTQLYSFYDFWRFLQNNFRSFLVKNVRKTKKIKHNMARILDFAYRKTMQQFSSRTTNYYYKLYWLIYNFENVIISNKNKFCQKIITTFRNFYFDVDETLLKNGNQISFALD